MQQDQRHEALIQLLERLNKAVSSATPISGTGCCPDCPYRFDPLLDRTEAWAYTGFKPGTFATWDCNKIHDLHPIKFGNAVRYRFSTLNAFVDKHLRP